MEHLDVRLIRLEKMTVISALGFGSQPELLAWDKILAFAREHGLLELPQRPRFFGFNNPNPSMGSPNYGYEQWMTLPPGFHPESGLEIKEIPARLYAVTRFQGLEQIGQMWMRLVAWCETCPYRMAEAQCLEELISPIEDMDDLNKYVFDLYLPLIEPA
jgi:effector-binding domain-containing protein